MILELFTCAIGHPRFNFNKITNENTSCPLHMMIKILKILEDLRMKSFKAKTREFKNKARDCRIVLSMRCILCLCLPRISNRIRSHLGGGEMCFWFD